MCFTLINLMMYLMETFCNRRKILTFYWSSTAVLRYKINSLLVSRKGSSEMIEEDNPRATCSTNGLWNNYFKERGKKRMEVVHVKWSSKLFTSTNLVVLYFSIICYCFFLRICSFQFIALWVETGITKLKQTHCGETCMVTADLLYWVTCLALCPNVVQGATCSSCPGIFGSLAALHCQHRYQHRMAQRQGVAQELGNP